MKRGEEERIEIIEEEERRGHLAYLHNSCYLSLYYSEDHEAVFSSGPPPPLSPHFSLGFTWRDLHYLLVTLQLNPFKLRLY